MEQLIAVAVAGSRFLLAVDLALVAFLTSQVDTNLRVATKTLVAVVRLRWVDHLEATFALNPDSEGSQVTNR